MSQFLLKNLIAYQFTDSEMAAKTAEGLLSHLHESPFTPCKPTQEGSIGSVKLPGIEKHAAAIDAERVFFCITKETRKVPTQTLNLAVEAEIEKIRIEQDRPVRRKERLGIKEDKLLELLPRAFSSYKTTFGYIDIPRALLVLDCSSFSASEEICSFLRKCLGTLPIQTLVVKNSPGSVMTNWLLDSDTEANTPKDFDFMDGVKLGRTESGDKKTSTFNNTPAGDPQLQESLNDGQEVAEIVLVYQDKVGFKLTDELVIKQIKFSDLVTDHLMGQLTGEDLWGDFQATQMIQTAQLGQLVDELTDQFGGPLEGSVNLS